MNKLSRRSVLRTSLGFAAAGPLARPFVANAAATTATAWWAQGFIPDEDAALRKAVADYKKASGNTIELSIIPFAPLRQKIISAITSGVVPDLIDATPAEVTPEQAWAGRLEDVGDVVATQKAKMVPTAPESALCYNGVEKKHAYYGVPYKCSVRPFHIWGDLVEKAGYKRSDIPDRWDPFIDFFKPIQKKLRDQGMRHVYATGLVVSTIGGDPVSTFDQFLLAYGGENTVTKDGRLHSKDPEVREAAIKALEKLTGLYKEGYIPPGSVNWNDADDNNAFHAKLCVMDLDGTLSTEVAMIHNKKAYYEDMMTYAPPLSNAGKKVPSVFPVNSLLVPKGAKNVEVGQGLCQIPDRAQGQRRIFERRARPVSPGLSRIGQKRPVLARPQDRPAPAALCRAGPRQPDDPLFLRLQPGLCPGRDRACLGGGAGRHRQRRHESAGRGRQSLEADRGDLRQIPDRRGLTAAPAAPSSRQLEGL